MSRSSSSINEQPSHRAWDESAFNQSFHHEFARAGNVRIHYVIGGNGPLVTLLHGFPQNWREWRFVMPVLADAGYTVVTPLDGFDVGTVAEDIRQVIAKLGRDQEKGKGCGARCRICGCICLGSNTSGAG